MWPKQISDEFVSDIESVVKVGDTVQVLFTLVPICLRANPRVIVRRFFKE